MEPTLTLTGVGKSFTMHLQGGTRIPVVENVTFAVAPGECVVLGGPSGAGKSSLLKRMLLPRTWVCESIFTWLPPCWNCCPQVLL